MTTKDFLDLYARGQTGQQMTKNDFDMLIVETVMDLVDEYDLEWDDQDLVPNDPELLQNIFEAAKKLLLTTGIYNLDHWAHHACDGGGYRMVFEGNEDRAGHG